MRKVVAAITVLLVITQIVFAVLKEAGVWDIPILLMIAPILGGLFMGTFFIVGYVLWADKQEWH